MPPPAYSRSPKDCDHCRKPLENSGAKVVCPQCRVIATCSIECFEELWKVHGFGCSKNPKEGMKPRSIPLDPALCEACTELAPVLYAVTDSWKDGRVLIGAMAASEATKQMPQGLLSPVRLKQCLLTPQFKQLATFSLPAQFTTTSYPSFNHKPTQFRHQLVLVARFLLLHELTHFNSGFVLNAPVKLWEFLAATLEQILHVGSAEHRKMQAARVPGTAVPAYLDAVTDPSTALAWARLLGLKVLARPEMLSGGEYLALISSLVYLTDSVGLDRHNKAWQALWQVHQQCMLCPELLDYVPE